jgi:hypothetical protein
VCSARLDQFAVVVARGRTRGEWAASDRLLFAIQPLEFGDANAASWSRKETRGEAADLLAPVDEFRVNFMLRTQNLVEMMRRRHRPEVCGGRAR